MMHFGAPQRTQSFHFLLPISQEKKRLLVAFSRPSCIARVVQFTPLRTADGGGGGGGGGGNPGFGGGEKAFERAQPKKGLFLPTFWRSGVRKIGGGGGKEK